MQWSPEQLETAGACSFCGSTDSRELFVRPDGLPLHSCPGCGFAYLKRRPHAAALADYYGAAYFNQSDTYEDYFNYAQAVVDLGWCPRLARLGAHITQWRGLRVLDVGCAAGGTLAVLRKRGALVTGIELSEAASMVAREQFGLEVLHARLEDVPLAAAGYDVIMLFDVLEHLADPAAALKKLIAALAPGGRLALTVPNFDRFAAEGAAWAGVQGYWEHLNYFTGAFIAEAFAGLGMSICGQHTYTAGLTAAGRSEDQSLRRFGHRLRTALPVLQLPLRLVRLLKFKICGPPYLDMRMDNGGMDRFLLAVKKP